MFLEIHIHAIDVSFRQNYGERFSPQEFQAFSQDCQPQQGQIIAQAAAARLTFKQ